MPVKCKFVLNNYFAGAGTAVAAGAGAAAGAGTAVATGAGASGAVSSAFLHPTTERDKEATNSIATKRANIFFIYGKPPFKDFIKFVVM